MLLMELLAQLRDAFSRRAEVMASARMRPLANCGAATARFSKLHSVSPAITACSAGPAPL